MARSRTTEEDFPSVTKPDGSPALVDQMTKDYLESSAPNPTQASLDEVLAGATSVQVFDGGAAKGRPLEDRILYETHEPIELASLGACLRIVEDPSTFGHCMCLGSPTLQLTDASGATHVIGVHHGHGIRWNAWRYDARLVDGMDLAKWLEEHGVPELREEMEQAKREAKADNEQQAGWEAAIPVEMRPVWNAHKQEALRQGYFADLEPFREALEREVAEPAERVRVLLRWFGSGEGPWSGYRSYETLPEEFLQKIPISIVLAALQDCDLAADPALAEGAARYLAGWSFCKTRADVGLIGTELARALLEHVERRTDDEDRLGRALQRSAGPGRPVPASSYLGGHATVSLATGRARRCQ